ncbi:glycoside hydrolase family 2 protein [Breznakiella homolactica]|uniref:Glycoside hydrolase family 2 n=1 Tax=Breznakiella homolactica TaxID=2798577 RepID=A0A7T7XMT1_9SPIR|nr:sugar-binding domain-containing protein [Breznakiella homolactica]QQO09112.1 glycoside hydrolase family 2 [Breznakiella homolactica]
MESNLPRSEYPRPDFKRNIWHSLNGTWNFAFDDSETGEAQNWHRDGDFTGTITVPFPYQSAASGIGDTAYHPVLWYSRLFTVPENFGGNRILLCFGAADFEAKVWLNGCLLGSHTGGYTPFSFDITDAVSAKGNNRLVVSVTDRNDTDQPRGKQYWEAKPDRCWYTPFSGLWQSVWLEAVPDVYCTHISLIPDIDSSSVSGCLRLSAAPAQELRCSAAVQFKGRTIQTMDFSVRERSTSFTIHIREEDSIDEIHYWTPEKPNLYTVTFKLAGSEGTDEVACYFGMRKISIRNGRILLNNKPLYQRLILDQAYWDDGLVTPVSDEEFKRDVELIKELGFNGVRLHQKIEDPRFYYWADTLGLLVWGEMPSAYHFSQDSRKHIISEWQAFIERDMNHPSIICWVPLNESWGVRNIVSSRVQQEFAVSLYHLTKSMDPSRLVSTNDGWEQVTSDICGLHDYVRDGAEFTQRWADLPALMRGAARDRLAYAGGYSYQGEPVLVTEFGGIAFARDMDGGNWGYAGGAADEAGFLTRLEELVKAILSVKEVQGYCYTQLTDVFQEVNGLLHSDRKPKLPMKELRRIFTLLP